MRRSTKHFLLLGFLLVLTLGNTQRRLAFFEKFNDNANGWNVGNSYDNTYKIENSQYIIQHKQSSGMARSLMNSGLAFNEDFDMSANIKHLSGEKDFGIGFIFGASGSTNYYTFDMTQTGYYRLGKVTNGKFSVIKKWTKDNAVKIGFNITNRLSIIKKGSSYKFYINNVNVYNNSSITLFGTKLGFGLYNKQTIGVESVWAYGKEEASTNSLEIFNDTFNDNSNNWATERTQDADLYLSNGRYYFHHKRNKSTWMTNQSIKIDETRDFYIEAKIYKISGEENVGHGLIWGRKDWQNYYSFNVANSGYFRVSKEENDDFTNIKGWTKSSAVNKSTGKYNKLKIHKRGNLVRFYVNDRNVFETDYQRGFGDRIGFEVHKNQKIAVDYLMIAYTNDKTTITNNPPEIQINKPYITYTGSGYKTSTKVKKGELLHVEGKVVDNTGVSSVKVNGLNATLYSDGSYSSNVRIYNSGPVEIVAKDKMGLTSRRTFQVDVASNMQTVSTTNNPSLKGKRLAIVIGNSSYRGAGALKNPVNDARAMKIELEKLGFDVLKYENCDQRAMKRAIDEFGNQLKNYDIGFFFYAGHGLQANGLNYLIPVDAQLQSLADVEYDCVRADRIMSKMEVSNAKTNIIVLDACRNNPFERSWTRNTNGNGLAFMNAPKGSLIAYATAPGNTASDGVGKNGLYTSSLLKYISYPNISIESVFKKVRQEVIRNSNGKQTPWESTSLTGDFYFKKE